VVQLEELQQQWRRLDQKLDQSLALQTELVRHALLRPARRRVNWLAVSPAIDLVLSIGVLLLGAAFLSGYWHDTRCAAPAAVIMAAAAAWLVACIRQLDLVAGLDWSGPVADIQSSLEALRVVKIRLFKWVILLSPLLGFCGLVVGLHWLFGWLTGGRVAVVDLLNPWWVAGNYAFGVLFALLGYLVAGVLAKRCRGHRWWQSVLDDISGTSLKEAALDVERWASLRREA
jgi:hypothetical protein